MSMNTLEYANHLLTENAQLNAEVARLKSELSRYSMSPGWADQRMNESKFVRIALGFGDDADDVSPKDLVDAIARLNEQVRALAAENAQMLRLLTDISSHHVEYFSEGEDGMFAGVPLDYVSEINMYVSRDVNAENPFGATDAAIRELQAQELDCAADELMLADTVASTGVVAHLLRQRAARLRTGEVINA